MFDCLLAASAHTVPGDRWRTEVVEAARWSAVNEGPAGRLRELAGVTAFGLRLRSVEATAGDPATAWRQGAAFGAVLVLATGVTAQLAVATGMHGSGLNVVAALAATASAVAVVAGRRTLALVFAGLAFASALVAAPADLWRPEVSSLGLAVAALVGSVGMRAAARLPFGRVVLVALAVASVGVAAGGGTVATGVALVATLLVPAALLAVGAADPRFAVAAAVAWGWRFVAVDPSDVANAVAAIARGRGVDAVLVRLMAMSWAVAAAVIVAHRSARRAAAL